MTNPFTRFLRQWSSNPDFEEFVSYWDRLEAVVVRVYREKMTPEAAAAEFERVWPWLRHHYGRWEETLRPYWQRTQAAGKPTATDPFRLLLDLERPQAISGDWGAMQHLPAAREAINQYLVSQEANAGG